MDYKQKLEQWNSTQKYAKELLFLESLVYASDGDYVLDYGCGIGTARRFLSRNGFWVFGYDVNDYMDDKYWYDNSLSKEYSAIYFMHSFAHIPNPHDILRILRSKYKGATITVITPNKDWLDPDYNNDTTVVKHYTQSELKQIFEDCGYQVKLIGQFGELKNGHNERIFLQTT